MLEVKTEQGNDVIKALARYLNGYRDGCIMSIITDVSVIDVIKLIDEVNAYESGCIKYKYEDGKLYITGVSDNLCSVLKSNFKELHDEVFGGDRGILTVVAGHMSTLKKIITELIEPSDKFIKKHKAYFDNINDRKAFIKLRDALMREYVIDEENEKIIFTTFFDKLFMNITDDIYVSLFESVKLVFDADRRNINTMAALNEDSRLKGVIPTGDTDEMFKFFNDSIDEERTFIYSVKMPQDVNDAKYFDAVVNRSGNYSMLIETKERLLIYAVPITKISLITA